MSTKTKKENDKFEKLLEQWALSQRLNLEVAILESQSTPMLRLVENEGLAFGPYPFRAKPILTLIKGGQDV